MAQNSVIDRMDVVASQLEGAGAMRLAFLMDSVANTVSSTGHDKNAGIMDIVNRVVKPLGKALDATITKLLGDGKVRESLLNKVKAVPQEELEAALKDQKLVDSVRQYASNMSASDVSKLVKDPEGFARMMEGKLGGAVADTRTAASGISKAALMAMTILILLKNAPAHDLPSSSVGSGGAQTHLVDGHGDGHGHDQPAKGPGTKGTADSTVSKAIDDNLKSNFAPLEKIMKSNQVDKLFEGKTDIDFRNLTQAKVDVMVNSTLDEALKIPALKIAAAGMLMGDTTPENVSPYARDYVAKSMHSLIMSKLYDATGYNVLKRGGVAIVDGKVLKALNAWFADNNNIKRVMTVPTVKT